MFATLALPRPSTPFSPPRNLISSADPGSSLLGPPLLRSQRPLLPWGLKGTASTPHSGASSGCDTSGHSGLAGPWKTRGIRAYTRAPTAMESYDGRARSRFVSATPTGRQEGKLSRGTFVEPGGAVHGSGSYCAPGAPAPAAPAAPATIGCSQRSSVGSSVCNAGASTPSS